MKTDIVIIELDRPRELRFGHKALKLIKSMLKKSLMDSIKEGINGIEPETLEKILYAGLVGEDDTLTLEKIEDIIDTTPYSNLLVKMTEAIHKAYGIDEDTENDRFKEPEDKKK